MITSDLYRNLPTSDELPDSDNLPVDNEDQNLIPNVLLFLLKVLWAQRTDWYFGADMGIYHSTGVHPRVPVVPDGFLSLGVERRKGGKSRRSYITWEENGVVPILTLEVVSWSPGGEYDEKLEIYRKLGVLYYVIYNPEFWQRDRHQPFEVYKLIDGGYQLQIGEPFWMPEIGLGIGRFQSMMDGTPQELLCWFDAQSTRYLTSEERAEQAAERAEQAAERAEQATEQAEQATEQAEQAIERAEQATEQAEQAIERAEQATERAERLAARLRALGENPDQI